MSSRKIAMNVGVKHRISVGTTPSEIVYTEDSIRLLHYTPTVKKPCSIPVLIVYSLINRYYILDLQPDRSMIKKLLDEGLDVYVIDWGYPKGADRYLTLDDYVNGYLNDLVDWIRKAANIDKINLVGVCQGGTLAVMYAALHANKIKNLVTMVTPVNFDTDKGILHIWAKHLEVDKIVDYYGMVPGSLLNAGFLLIDPLRNMIDKYVGLVENIKLKNDDAVNNFLRMEQWIFDTPDQAGEAYRQFIKDCYQNNLLIKNQMQLAHKLIELKNITMPLLNVVAGADILVPNDASIPLNDKVASKDKEIMIFQTGHIGIFVSSKSQQYVCPQIAGWLKRRSITGKSAQLRGKK